MQKPILGPGPRAHLPAGAVRRKAKPNKNKDDHKTGKQHKERRHSEDRYSSAEPESDSDVEDAEDYKKGGYHPVQIGERFSNGKYVVLRKLGWGHFSTVWLVVNNDTGEYGAMKVQKSAKHYTEAALDEVTLLKQIRDGDPNDTKHCVRLMDSFEHYGPHGKHICMVFEVLGENLLALIKKYNYRGIPIPVVRNLARQMLIGLDYLHRQLHIIHTDFKPENVMLCDPLNDRSWELPDPASLTPAPTPTSSQQPSQSPQHPAQDASNASASTGLTKNQKKKAKKKAKKAAAKAGDVGQAEGFASDEDDTVATSNITSSQIEFGDEAQSRDNLVRGAASDKAATINGAGEALVSLTLHPPADRNQTETHNGHEQQHENGNGVQGNGSTTPLRKVVFIPGLTEQQLVTARCKLVDFGNGCWTYKQFTTDIQTRQYRSPEVILGAKYGTSCDMWSLACMLFELVTGDLLFDPRSGSDYPRDEDHLAQFMELLGRMPRKVCERCYAPLQVCERGKYASQYFNRHGDLRHIKKLNYWPLDRVLIEKYNVPQHEARSFADFLLPMLDFSPENRATAADMLKHSWLREDSAAEDVRDSRQRRRSYDERDSRPQRDTSRGSVDHYARHRTRSRSAHHHSRSPSPRHSRGDEPRRNGSERGYDRGFDRDGDYRSDGYSQGRYSSSERPAKKSRYRKSGFSRYDDDY